MTHTLTVELTQEQEDALTGGVALYNQANRTELTTDEYLIRNATASVDMFAQTAYQNALRRIGESAKELPYESRLALIASVESQIPKK